MFGRVNWKLIGLLVAGTVVWAAPPSIGLQTALRRRTT